MSVAVLLDNFVTASTVMENAQRDRKLQERKALTQFQNPLQPLILRLADRSAGMPECPAMLELCTSCCGIGLAELVFNVGSQSQGH